MRRYPFPALCAIALACSAAAAAAAPLTPNAGALTVNGSFSGNATGSFNVQALLKDGNFTGSATLSLNGGTLAGSLVEKRSYLENGHCVFRVENGRAHADLRGTCDSGTFNGTVDGFIPGANGGTGAASGTVALSGPAPAPAAAGRVPSGKLVCAYNEPRIGIRMGEATTYSLRFSNMPSLALAPDGTYAGGKSGRGRYSVAGGKVRLESGPWAGAVGTLENDRSGKPAVVFHIEENKAADGVPIVDPYTTHCTAPR